MKSNRAVFSGRFGEIIEERIAGVAPDQERDITRRTVIEVLLTRPDVPLTGPLRLQVACALEQLWIPPRELQKIYLQRRLEHYEEWLSAAKWTRKTKPWAKAGKPKPKGLNQPPLDVVADFFGFRTPNALAQFLKRERGARKTAASQRRSPPLPLWLMFPPPRSGKPRP
jgi:hypothetical protein